ncbi:iron ABC transporter ATP-binding protein [Marinomonas transparens]|uniref:ATP-binding cassette domain-containing protein n=1 Tax=Marinomonas transparens TaxID=2795388 RepID=A0A934JR77_9GAMM|nr:ATP-binding cassette domain-containing protein [Marinomonas transparens]MBJ7538338.1 ATP-binding cassette domain-containing protein [Marinomonas transparens]
MIEVQSLNKKYGTTPVLKEINLTLPDQGVTALIGPNGAGKSTLLGVMSRLQAADAGRVMIDGLDVHQTSNAVLSKKMAILRQDNTISLRLKVYDFVAFGRFPYSQGKLTQEDMEHVDRALDYLNLNDLRHRYLDELSGGQRQRACIAMVLCQNTKYLLLDEPLNNLDMKHAVDIMKLIRRAADDLQKQVVVVLHDINFASCYADRIIAMKLGGVVYDHPPELLMTTDIMRDLYGIEMTIHSIQDRPIGFYHL